MVMVGQVRGDWPQDVLAPAPTLSQCLSPWWLSGFPDCQCPGINSVCWTPMTSGLSQWATPQTLKISVASRYRKNHPTSPRANNIWEGTSLPVPVSTIQSKSVWLMSTSTHVYSFTMCSTGSLWMVLKYIHIYLLWAAPDVRFPLTAQTFESCLQLILRKMLSRYLCVLVYYSWSDVMGEISDV